MSSYPRFYKFNINWYIKVKLTDYAKELHKRWHDDFNKNLKKEKEYVPIEEDEEGWSIWQFWMFCRVFGAHIGFGLPDILKDVEILIEKGNDEQ